MHRQSRARSTGATGFTLVELAITLSILAIACAMAFPSFLGLIRSNRLSTAANEVVVALQTARSEAIKLNGAVSVCRSEDATNCASGGAWTGLIIVDRGGNVLRVMSLGTSLEVQSDAALSALDDTVTFGADGIAHASNGAPVAATLSICMPVSNPSDNIRQVVITGGSRISVTRASGGGACS